MAKSIQSDPILLKKVRLSFPQLFKPRAFQPGQTPRYEASFLLDPANADHAAQLKALAAEVQRLAREKWGDKPPKDIKVCITSGDDKEYDGYAGMKVLSSHNTTRPTLVNRRREPVAEGDPQAPYAGCYVNATINLWVQDNQYGKRINASLRAVQFVEDGEAFGRGPVDAEQEFEALEDGPGETGADDFNFG